MFVTHNCGARLTICWWSADITVANTAQTRRPWKVGLYLTGLTVGGGSASETKWGTGNSNGDTNSTLIIAIERLTAIGCSVKSSKIYSSAACSTLSIGCAGITTIETILNFIIFNKGSCRNGVITHFRRKHEIGCWGSAGGEVQNQINHRKNVEPVVFVVSEIVVPLIFKI
jgi:hypothetical protein